MSATKKAQTPVPAAVEKPATTPTPAEKPKSPEVVSYFRMKKISAYLYQILEVEIDENLTPPKPVGKQDMRELVLDQLFNLVCPHPDFKRKK